MADETTDGYCASERITDEGHEGLIEALRGQVQRPGAVSHIIVGPCAYEWSPEGLEALLRAHRLHVESETMMYRSRHEPDSTQLQPLKMHYPNWR